MVKAYLFNRESGVITKDNLIRSKMRKNTFFQFSVRQMTLYCGGDSEVSRDYNDLQQNPSGMGSRRAEV